MEAARAPQIDAEEELLELKEEFARRLGAADKAIAALKVPSLRLARHHTLVALLRGDLDLGAQHRLWQGARPYAKPLPGGHREPT